MVLSSPRFFVHLDCYKSNLIDYKLIFIRIILQIYKKKKYDSNFYINCWKFVINIRVDFK